MSTDQIIALVAVLGTCVSAVATLLTVRQIAKQREASYRPELALSRVHVECVKDPIAGSLPTFWSATKEGRKTSVGRLFALPLQNVGLGTAKNVRVSWSAPFAAAVKQINEMAQRNLAAAYFTFDDDTLSIKSEKLGNSMSIWKNQQANSLDYVLPASVQSEPVMLALPDAYIQVVSALVFFAAKEKDMKSFPELPVLKAEFLFLDIGEGEHRSNYEIGFHVAMIVEGGESFHGTVEPKKCGGAH